MSRRRRFRFAAAFAFVWLSSAPAPAQAHLVNTNVGEFYAGMMDPLTSLEHLLPRLALAVLASQCGMGVLPVLSALVILVLGIGLTAEAVPRVR